LADGRAVVLDLDHHTEQAFNARFACPHCNYAIGELEPRLFSFNSPLGACPACEGLGEPTGRQAGHRREVGDEDALP
jgi:excinuclease ABC subunit A